MNSYNAIDYKENNNVITDVNLIRKKDGVILTDITFNIGDTLIVKPMNKQKLKHRDRRVKIIGFLKDDLGNVDKASVKFLDNNRNGRVEIIDLDSLS